LGKQNRIVYASGDYPGSIHDITIARNNFLGMLLPNESIVVDKGYRGDHRCIIPLPKTSFHNIYQNSVMGGLRQNIERINNRIKIFNIARIWRGDRDNHGNIFLLVCKITNLEMEVHPLNRDRPERDSINFF